LPGGEPSVEVAAGLFEAGFEAGDVLGGVHALFGGEAAEFLDLVLEIEERFFEWEDIGGHRRILIR
jgi:hypothetical protein